MKILLIVGFVVLVTILASLFMALDLLERIHLVLRSINSKLAED